MLKFLLIFNILYITHASFICLQCPSCKENSQCNFAIGICECLPNYANCGQSINVFGCPIYLPEDKNHCGTCFNNCGDNSQCLNRECYCLTGYKKCNSTLCETSIYEDVNNCGDCDHKCSLVTNSLAVSCINGECVYQCKSGYSGKLCQNNIDECVSKPCYGNNTVCQDNINGYSCICNPGYSGLQCQVDINECVSTPCQNGATCRDGLNSYLCDCQSGYSGTLCQNNINECVSIPCQNGGTCKDGINSYTCICQQGFAGLYCQTDIDECISNPCQNGGICNSVPNGYTCNCPTGYSGSYCQTNINECSLTPCQNGGTCTDGINSYTCRCNTGYSGPQCQTNINECLSTPCQNNGICIDGINSYLCNCPTGYNGLQCQTNINECVSTPCQNEGTCVDGINNYVCNCKLGYSGSRCQINIDECLSTPCQNGGTCIDGINHYSCNCSLGTSGTLCQTNINECLSTPCQNGGTCVDGIGSFICLCTIGYIGSICEVNGDNGICLKTVNLTYSNILLQPFRMDSTATSTGSKALFAGGVNFVGYPSIINIYDSTTNTWSTTTFSVPRSRLTATSLGSKAFFAGGYNGVIKNNIDIYNILTNSWSTAALSVARFDLAATSVSSKVIFAGGATSFTMTPSNIVDIYDSDINTWTTTLLNIARYRLTATSVGSKALFAGGFTGSNLFTNMVDIYDSNTNIWSTSFLTLARGDLTATNIGSKAFFAGGQTSSGITNVVDIYDSIANTWTLSYLSLARSALTSASLDSLVFFAGGRDPFTSTPYNVIDIYNSVTNTWSTGSLKYPKYQFTAASAGNKAIFLGGLISDPTGQITVDIIENNPEKSLSCGCSTTKLDCDKNPSNGCEFIKTVQQPTCPQYSKFFNSTASKTEYVIDDRGNVLVWGDNTYGQACIGSTNKLNDITLIPSLINIVAGCAGETHMCAIDSVGKLFCCGTGLRGQLGVKDITVAYGPVQVSGFLAGKNVKQVTCGKYHTVALTDEVSSNVYFWGDGSKGQLCGWNTGGFRDDPSFGYGTLVKVSAGDYHTCGLNIANTLYCCGSNTNGQVTGFSPTVDGYNNLGFPYSSLFAYGNSTTITNVNLGYVQGDNTYGQLGFSSLTSINGLTSITLTGTNFASARLLGGSDYQAILFSNGTVSATGRNNYGQLGVSNVASRSYFLPIGAQFHLMSEVHAGLNHMCGIALNKSLITCIGDPYFSLPNKINCNNSLLACVCSFGQLNDVNNCGACGNKCSSVNGYYNYKCISGVCTSDTCQPGFYDCNNLILDGCESDPSNDFNNCGSCGNQCTIGIHTACVAGQCSVVTGVFNTSHSNTFYMIFNNKRVLAWGNNEYGQYGDGTKITSNKPVLLPLTDIVSGCGGTKHACATTSNGSIYCWGNNEYGQLGDDTLIDSMMPKLVFSKSNSKSIACGPYYTYVTGIENDYIYFTGLNDYGQSASGYSGNIIRQFTSFGGLSSRAFAGLTVSYVLDASGRSWGSGTSSYDEILFYNYPVGANAVFYPESVGPRSYPFIDMILTDYTLCATVLQFSDAWYYYYYDQGIICWGDKRNNQVFGTLIPSGYYTYQSYDISTIKKFVGGYQFMGILNNNGQLTINGLIYDGTVNEGIGYSRSVFGSYSSFDEVAATKHSICAVERTSKKIVCWGSNANKELIGKATASEIKFTPYEYTF